MIKFIMQRYANSNGVEQELSEKNNRKTHNPQINQSTIALKNLRQTQDQVDSLRRRLSVLQIRDQKNQQRAKQNERKIQFHALIQDSIAKAKKRKQKHLERANKNLQASKQKISMFREQRTHNLSEAKSNLLESKSMDRSRIRQASQQNEKNLSKRKFEDLSQKMNQRQAISRMQKLQKEHIQQYFFKKKSNFRDSCAREGSQFESRRSSRQKLLQQLTARESLMIQRQSSSRAALDQTSKRVYKISSSLKPIKRQKSTSDFSERLPPVKSKKNQQFVFLQ